MAAPMRDSSLDGGHRAKVADPRTAATKADSATTNFGEYDDNEWDIGIGDLIIDLDADIEKTNEKTTGGGGGGGPGTTSATTMASAASAAAAAAAAAKTSGKMAVEHSATVDKGLKMKIKRTKPGTKTSEAKHEIVKSGEQNGGDLGGVVGTGGGATGVMGSGGGSNGGSVDAAVVNKGGKHPGGSNQQQLGQQQASVASGGNGNGGGGGNVSASSKRGSSGHRRDKARDKHGADKQPASNKATPQTPTVASGNAGGAADVNGIVRPTVQRVVFPVTTATGPGPPIAANAPGPPPAPTGKSVDSAAQVVNKSAPPSPAPAPPPTATPPVCAPPTAATVTANSLDDSKPSPPSSATSPPPPAKKLKAASPDTREMVDVCVGTSVGTITEPDCLGPCEPGTSVTLEGIVWHETEGVLVVNVTWRGKTYVGTLLDCTRHDWAPPRFCDSPTSDLDARTPKGRGKRGRGATGSSPANDLSNFTETRSSVHSKLRSNNNGGAKGRRGPSSPTPFVPPRPDATPSKRKPRAPEDEAPTKKSRGPTPAPPSTPASASSSPPSSPVLLECPEPNCSKKYKHINGLKYHQSHAHGSADDEETKESASMSETEEEPSPAPHSKKEEPSPVENSVSPGTPGPTNSEAPTPSPQQPPSTPTPDIEPPPTPDKGVVKPGVLRFGMQEESLLTVPTINPTPRPIPTVAAAAISTIQPPSPASQPQQQPQQPTPTLPMTSQPPPVQLVIQPPTPQQQQPPPLQQQQQQQQQPPQQPPPQTVHVPQIPVQQTLPQQNPQIAKVPQFKVKPASALMPDDKKAVKPIGHKKKNRKSPAGSPHPHPHPLEPPALGLEAGGREDVLSPAYSDISDDAAPLLEAEVDSNKSKTAAGEKKVEVGAGQSPQSMQHYGMYPYYGQPPYLVPSVTADKSKECMNDKGIENKPGPDKEKKDNGPNVGSDYQQKLLQQHYYPYGYVPSYPYNLDTGYPVAMVATEEKGPGGKDEKSPGPIEGCKQNLPPAPTAIHVPNPNKVKTEPGVVKDKSHQNENHQILKESIEMKNQMSPAYLYSRQQQHQQQQTQQQQQQQQQQEDLRRYYIYPERRKEHSGQQDNTTGLKATPPPQPKQTLPAPSPKHKDKQTVDEKKDDRVKQEGVKPTMETQGPPPPPTSSYAYIHSGYMQSPHYGAIPFDPGHPVYRGMNPMLVPGPYPNNPYLHPQLHPQLPRYHAPEDLSRPPPGPPKALDLLQHHANQYYSSHKIHELQERALKSPTPKTATSSSSPSGDGRQNVNTMSAVQGPPVSSAGPQPTSQANSKQQQGDNKDNRSPPPQRHVHTHHHTHVGLGYPILAGQYPAPYGAAVLASQQAAAVGATVINPYSPK